MIDVFHWKNSDLGLQTETYKKIIINYKNNFNMLMQLKGPVQKEHKCRFGLGIQIL